MEVGCLSLRIYLKSLTMIYINRNKTENKKRPYGYDVEYQNVDINTLLKKPNLLITAVDKNIMNIYKDKESNNSNT